jgi:glycosyltransferase involved in cell wall biosynthesis
VLITNCALTGPSGTEIVVRDLARELCSRGHEVTIYSPRLGIIAEQARAAGARITSDLAEASEPEVVHGHHHLNTVTALLRFPRTCGIFVCHDAKAWHDVAPLFPRILRYVAVDLACRDRLLADGVDSKQISMIPNAVDLKRFQARGPLPARPRRALVFSNNVTEGPYLDLVREVCRSAAISIDVVGSGVRRQSDAPEELLGQYDLVFAKARCALEAMAVGCAVILMDPGAMGGMVTTTDFAGLKLLNFGRRALTRPINAQSLAAEIARYDSADARAVSQLVRAGSSLDNLIHEWIDLYTEVKELSQSVIYDPAAELVWMSDYLRTWGWDSRIEWEKEQFRKIYNLRWIGPVLEHLTEKGLRRLASRTCSDLHTK